MISEKIIRDAKKLIGFCGYSKEGSNKYRVSKKFYEFFE